MSTCDKPIGSEPRGLVANGRPYLKETKALNLMRPYFWGGKLVGGN